MFLNAHHMPGVYATSQCTSWTRVCQLKISCNLSAFSRTLYNSHSAFVFLLDLKDFNFKQEQDFSLRQKLQFWCFFSFIPKSSPHNGLSVVYEVSCKMLRDQSVYHQLFAYIELVCNGKQEGRLCLMKPSILFE